MIDLLLVVLYYFSLFMMTAGIWKVIDSTLSKDKSMGTGTLIGALMILIGVLIFAALDTSKSDDKIETPNDNSHKPVPMAIPS